MTTRNKDQSLEDESSFNGTRRRILQLAGVGGIASFGPTIVSASKDEKRAEDVTFAEFGLIFEYSGDLESGEHYDQLDFYKINNEDLMFSAIKESNLEKFEEADAVMRHHGFHTLPTRLPRKEYGTVWESLNERYKPQEGVLLETQSKLLLSVLSEKPPTSFFPLNPERSGPHQGAQHK